MLELSTELLDGKTYTISFDDTVTDISGLGINPKSVQIKNGSDVIAPSLLRAPLALDNNTVCLFFSESVAGAENKNNYKITPFLPVKYVLDIGNNGYRLITDPQVPKEVYEISVTNVSDKVGNRFSSTNKNAKFIGFQSADIIKVSDTVKADYKNIYDAVYNSPAGSVICVSAGTYDYLPLPVTKDVTIIGGYNPKTWKTDGKSATIINSSSSKYDGIVVSANVRLINIHIKNAYDGLRVNDGFVIVYGCSFYNNKNAGVTFGANSSGYLFNNRIFKNESNGINLLSDLKVSIVNNVIDNNYGNGIDINTRKQQVIANNIISFNAYGLNINGAKDGVSDIIKNCFYKNNHGKSQDSTFMIYYNVSGEISILNDKDGINKTFPNWVGNIVSNPLWTDNADYVLPINSNLLTYGDSGYLWLYDLLPNDTQKIKYRKNKLPVGVIY